MKTNGKLGVRSGLLVSALCLWAVSLTGTGWCGDGAGADGSVKKQGEQTADNASPVKERQPPRVRMPKFAPPKRGAPVGRIAGGARGTADGVPTLVALTPDQMAFTAVRSPTVYWFTSEIPPWPVELTVTEPRAETPVLIRRLPVPAAAGIQRVSLEELGVYLEPDRDYRWYVALVRDEDRRSRDLLAFGGLRWVKPTEELQADLEMAPPGIAPADYAAAGYWYDALDGAIRLAESGPYRVEALAARDSLLAQVGLAGLVPVKGKD